MSPKNGVYGQNRSSRIWSGFCGGRLGPKHNTTANSGVVSDKAVAGMETIQAIMTQTVSPLGLNTIQVRMEQYLATETQLMQSRKTQKNKKTYKTKQNNLSAPNLQEALLAE